MTNATDDEAIDAAAVRAAAVARLRTHITRVVHTERRTPMVTRVTFGGGDLETFVPIAPDQFLYVLLPPAGHTELTIDASFTWEKCFAMDEELRPVGAYYTVRHYRPETAELDMDFFLHPDVGPASGWAAQAKPGDPAALWGPRTTYAPPADGADWYLLVADETGVPAVASILEFLPQDALVHAFLEVPDESEQHSLMMGPQVQVSWLHRGEAPAGTTTNLVDAVRALDLPPGRPYVWGGGESRAMTGVRKYLRREVGLAHDRVSLTAYWRHTAHRDDPVDDEE